MKRTLPRWSLPLAFGLLLGASALFGRAPQFGEFRVHAVAGSVSYVEGAGGNIGVSAGDDGLFVIDDQLANARDQVVEAVKSVGDGPVRFLLNTHWHGDHTGNNVAFADTAAILAHTNVRRRLAGDPTVEGKKDEGTPPEALPVLTYEDGVTLHLNGEDIVVTHFGPAHTDGDSTAFFSGSNVLHMGDLFFSGRFPYIDLDSGGDVQGFVEAVGAILENVGDDTKIIPGHGPLSTKDDLRRYHAMLLETTGRVREALGAGKSIEDMKGEGIFGDFREDWSWQFIDADRFLEILVRGLSG